LTPFCGLDVHYPTWALKSDKDPGNIFNLAKSGQELDNAPQAHSRVSNINFDI
jgi:hypothetical protein